MPGSTGRADLLRALVRGGPELLRSAATIIGYAHRPRTPPVVEQRRATPPAIGADAGQAPVSEEEPTDAQELIPFWHLVKRETLDGEKKPGTEEGGSGGADGSNAVAETWPQPAPAPVPPPLAAWRQLSPRLRRLLARRLDGREVNLPRLVARFARGEYPQGRLPRKKRRRWGDGLHVVVDRSDHLTPVWFDQDQVCNRLRRLFPRGTVREVRHWPSRSPPVWFDVPPRNATVLVLGDLGALGDDPGQQVEVWRRFGRQLKNQGNRPLALMPAPAHRWPPALRRQWQMLAWERPAALQTVGETNWQRRAQRLLTLVSPALRVEPGFLRQVRLLLSAEEADAGTELDVWRHPAIINRCSVAATIDPDTAKALRRRFAEEKPQRRRQVLALLRRYRQNLAPEIWLEEIISLDERVKADLPVANDLKIAERHYYRLAQQFLSSAGVDIPEGAGPWFRRSERRLPDAVWTGAFGQSLQRIWWGLHRGEPDLNPPPGFQPGNIPAVDRSPKRWAIRQREGRLVFSQRIPVAGLEGAGADFLATIDSRGGPVKIFSDSFWQSGLPPSWADAWDWDCFGPWVEFSLDGVRQRLRWIPPGRFLMGSPVDEPGRFNREGPQHVVTIGQGFWLFDTVCTQALWQTVMDENPSRFQSPERPVESVSWNEVKTFLQRINVRLPGLELGLPSEAQWEYACRAGTVTSFSFGNRITSEQVNYNGRWSYGEKQESEFQKETVAVATLPPNPWGLFEMHGNVREWCADVWQENHTGAPDDGQPWSGPAVGHRFRVLRVVRGGSWSDVARYVRSPSRDWRSSDDRFDSLGFRCFRAPVSPTGQRGTELVAPAFNRLAERAAASGTSSTAVVLDPEPAAKTSCTIPPAMAFHVWSNQERLTFQQWIKPSWANAMGHDVYGPWAELLFQGVRQRLRWIPPGRFLMGSPENEPGRFDREGPRHEVNLSRGYWLFDTPCTQALWQAVMGDNPSRFQSPDRPVERVRFNRVQQFLARINEQVPGLELGLPNEAQWEYACRAGSETALYSGRIEILGYRNAPALDAIAWYGGNSGQGFDLKNGYDSSEWPEKQYAHEKAATRVVKLKSANAWGLYDMLGNVWEWCADGRRQYAAEDVTDPEGPTGDGVLRVVRGGSWRGYARYARSAYRFWPPPDVRDVSLGFRCSRVHL